MNILYNIFNKIQKVCGSFGAEAWTEPNMLFFHAFQVSSVVSPRYPSTEGPNICFTHLFHILLHIRHVGFDAIKLAL